MTMAYWNGMTWGVSTKEIAYLESLTTVFGIETDTNADKEGKSPTETVAPSLIEFAFNTTYRVETGTRDIRGIIEEWKSLVGKIGALVIGGSIFGPDRMQLQSVGVSNLEIDARGTMRAVNLAFKFKEVPAIATGTTTTTTQATGTASAKSINSVTTVFLQSVDQSVKETVKTVTMEADGKGGSHISSSGATHGGGGGRRKDDSSGGLTNSSGVSGRSGRGSGVRSESGGRR